VRGYTYTHWRSLSKPNTLHRTDEEERRKNDLLRPKHGVRCCRLGVRVRHRVEEGSLSSRAISVAGFDPLSASSSSRPYSEMRTHGEQTYRDVPAG
jgi:hypothetical protein